MLSKQCWRSIQDPHSLATKVIKAKYYPPSSFQNAKVGSKPSYVWKSFLEAGSYWRIGTGHDIHIWQDKWLDLSNPRKVFSPVKVLESKAKVAEWIDPISKQWRIELVEEIFEQGEANIILNTPVSTVSSRDRIMWKGTKDSSFL